MSSTRRRALLLASLGACFVGLTPAAFARVRAEARAAGRPLFTAGALNRMLPGVTDPKHGPVLLEAARDVRGFIQARFTLTAAQQAELASVSEAELARLSALLRRAAAERGAVQVAIEAARRGNDAGKRSRITAALPEGHVEVSLSLRGEARTPNAAGR